MEKFFSCYVVVVFGTKTACSLRPHLNIKWLTHLFGHLWYEVIYLSVTMAKEVPQKRQWFYPNMATRWQLTQITLHENMRLHISATILQALHAGDDINSETHPCYLGLTAWCEIVFGLLLKLGSPFGESIWIYIVDYGIYKIPRNVKLVDLSKFFVQRSVAKKFSRPFQFFL